MKAAAICLAILLACAGAPSAVADDVNQQNTGWKLSGDKTLQPTSIRDDGRKTYITWLGDRAIPAVFALGPGGEEEMVEGYVRTGVFTIDRVYDDLRFRIDRRVAKAKRRTNVGSGQQ